MAGVRMTGLTSGLDTESLVGELSKAYQKKVDNAKKQQTKTEWKKEAWASLNTKLMNFYKGALSTFKSTGTYSSKTINGELSGVKITAGAKATNGNHKVQVTNTASAQMWTGHKINENKYTATSYKEVVSDDQKISDLYNSNGYSILTDLNGKSFTVGYGENSVDIDINIDENTTVKDMIDSINAKLVDTGLTASFENGALTFANTSAVESTDENGEITYKDGYAITVNAKDEASGKALGIAYDKDGKGTVINQLSQENKTNTFKGTAFAYEKVITDNATVGKSTRLTDIGIAEGTVIKVNDTEIRVDRTTTLSGLATSMANAGINANYDADQGRFYLSSKATGKENGFEISSSDADALAKLGLDYSADATGKIDASDASIIYNGVPYTQSSNSFSINGLTIDVNKTGEAQEFSVNTDIDGIYDKVKNFVKEYNSLITEMNKLYNADSSRGYDPLTSEEKDAMTEEDIKNWETKIKDSLLRRDSTISSLLTSMRTTLNKSVEFTNSEGTTSHYALSSFGIITGNYTEKGQLHIEGDADDGDYSSKEDKLKAAIAANPEALIKTLTTLGTEMYENFQKAMKKTESSSAMTFYNDVTLDKEIKSRKDDVSELQEKMQDEEDRYYKQFSAMETAMAKLQSQQTYISQLFGG